MYIVNFLDMAKNIESELIDIRRGFHENPELGFDLFKTSQKVKDFLLKEGIEFYEVAQTGICAIIRGKGEKTIALRADMDALPLQDKKICDYSSKINGKMHACGHDAHTTILLGAAKILNSMKDKIPGNVKLLFEPAEETTGGSPLMIKEGVLENPNVDAIIGLHVEEFLEAGTVGLKRGVAYAASNPFTIKVVGKGGHGASPHMTVDPIVIASNVIISLQNIVSREIPPTDPAVITIGSIHGGTAQNIIPEEVTISGIIRTMKSEHREYIKTRLVQVVEGIVTAMRGECEISIEESYPCLYNNDKLAEMFESKASQVISESNVYKLDQPTMGVESFAYFSMERPALFYFLGSGNKEKGIVNPAHGSLFDIDESCISIGVAMQCTLAYEFLLNS
ncbi:amidohydrolase [Clostridium sp. CM028]|uniref:M20 metallopeptidase family protein n=2 Tax=Clostridium TaxID=1485 RepID=UPI001C0AB096|nr:MULTISPECIES: M20 family metallopeptidase [unclassified Clostridium]MBU3090600.1 amidohydrolase [Clostridium sp. CF011]MBW9144401.1 amidohydrolase [Clostridium sp. CM027]MBW9149362.1 amidohydrolase [Clostridium sp. CM028]UVE40970.1 amidohydrolase [Clostridium sp. CM027]WAG69952.1 M20 family metallopeptidase [Clostridium sp. CF011]